MTREEYIRGFVSEARILSLNGSDFVATADGCRVGANFRIALRCRCGAPQCQGWMMVTPGDAAEHMKRFGAAD